MHWAPRDQETSLERRGGGPGNGALRHHLVQGNLDDPLGAALLQLGDEVAELVLIHYADPSAAGRDERVDRSDVTAPLVAEGEVCSATAPCPGTGLCAGATDTAFTGRCFPNPRLPYLPYCGGFTQIPCDDGFTCELLNPTNPNSIGYCVGYPYRDYDVHGPTCGSGQTCPAVIMKAWLAASVRNCWYWTRRPGYTPVTVPPQASAMKKG